MHRADADGTGAAGNRYAILGGIGHSLGGLMYIKSLLIGTVAVLAAHPAAAVELVKNGGFEAVTLNGAPTTGSYEFGSRYPTVQVTNWTTNGYNFLFAAGSADTVGATGEFNNLQLWGPNNGSANGLPAASPAGGNFVGADGAFGTDAISQVITGLTPNAAATLTFYWGAAQQSGFDGATTEQWQVTLGSQTQSTAVFANPNHGFSGWIKQTFTFTPTTSTATLSFLSVGTPAGVPPFAVLDGVSLQQAVPEPATWALLITGFAMVGIAARRRRPTAVAA